MAEVKSIVFTLIIAGLVVGVLAIYGIVNSEIESQSLSASLPLPKIVEEMPPVPGASSAPNIDEININVMEVEVSDPTVDAISTDVAVNDPGVAGEITEIAVLDDQLNPSKSEIKREVSPTAKTGSGAWGLFVAVLAMLLGFLGFFLSSKFLILR